MLLQQLPAREGAGSHAQGLFARPLDHKSAGGPEGPKGPALGSHHPPRLSFFLGALVAILLQPHLLIYSSPKGDSSLTWLAVGQVTDQCSLAQIQW